MKLRTIFEEMTHEEFLIVFVCLLLAFGLVSSSLISLAADGGGNLVMNKNRNSEELFMQTYWTMEKYAGDNNIVNASSASVNYYVNVTELETINGTLIMQGYVRIKNTGGKNSYIGNVVLNLLTKNGGWGVATTNVKDYYK